MNERALRSEICDVARSLYERGHNAPPDGNITARLSERYLLSTPTMCHKGFLRPEQIVKVSASDGRPTDPAQKASSEIRMHVAIYKARADVHAIVHAHSPNAVGLTVAGISMDKPVVPEVILALGSVPTIPYASPTTEDVPAIVLEYVHRHDGFLLERHGPVALGKTLNEALMRLEVIEHTAKITIAALAAGSAEPIDPTERGKLLALGGRATERAALDKLVDLIADRVVMRLRLDD